MSQFILSGFADEIDANLDVQISVLKQLGIHFIEPRTVDGKNISSYTPQEAKVIHQRLADAGIRVSSVGSPIGKIKITDDFAPHMDAFKRTIEIAQVLNSQYIRMFSFVMPQDEPYSVYEDEVFARLSQFVEAAKGSGVTLLHENEKHIYGDMAPRCLQIAKAFENELFLVFDPSNFVQCGQDTIEAFRILKPYVRYIHMKDSQMTNEVTVFDKGFDTVSDAHRPVGLGSGNFRYIFEQLHRDGYQGFISLEPHLSQNATYEGTGAYKFAVAANWARKLIYEVVAGA